MYTEKVLLTYIHICEIEKKDLYQANSRRNQKPCKTKLKPSPLIFGVIQTIQQFKCKIREYFMIATQISNTLLWLVDRHILLFCHMTRARFYFDNFNITMRYCNAIYI